MRCGFAGSISSLLLASKGFGYAIFRFGAANTGLCHHGVGNVAFVGSG